MSDIAGGSGLLVGSRCPRRSARMIPMHSLRPLPRDAGASAEAPASTAALRDRSWTLFSNHGLVLIVIATDPTLRVRDIAERVGITERAAHRLVADLCAEGFLSRRRVGRRTLYHVHAETTFRHPALEPQAVSSLLRVLIAPGDR
jgi:MarR family